MLWVVSTVEEGRRSYLDNIAFLYLESVQLMVLQYFLKVVRNETVWYIHAKETQVLGIVFNWNKFFFTWNSRRLHLSYSGKLSYALSGRALTVWMGGFEEGKATFLSLFLSLFLPHLQQLQESVSLKDTYGQNMVDRCPDNCPVTGK